MSFLKKAWPFLLAAIVVSIGGFIFWRSQTPDSQNDITRLKRQETFTRLRGMFENPILDEDFKTLKQVTSSTVYLDFLKQAYRTAEPFETLSDFMKVAPPPKDRYRDFLNQHFENLTYADFQGLHLLTMHYRKAELLGIHADQTRDQKTMQAAIMAKFGIFMKEGPISTWVSSRMPSETHENRVAFLLRVEKFAMETQLTDTAWIQAQFDAHGQADGLLWIALKNPRLIGEIVSNFPNTDLFRHWVEQTYLVKKRTELEKL